MRDTSHRVAVILLAETDTHEAMGRIANALTVTKESVDAGDEVRHVLDGAGTKWMGGRARWEDHRYHGLFEDVRDRTGACMYSAKAYGVNGSVQAARVQLLDECRGHPSVRQLIFDGHEIVSF